MSKQEKRTFQSIRVSTSTLIKLRKLQAEKKEEINFEKHVPISDIVDTLIEQSKNNG